jgi:CBS domain-containing protein
MTLPAAARLLLRRNAVDAAVTDSGGRCVGLLRAADFVRWAAEEPGLADEPRPGATGVWCDWQLVNPRQGQPHEVRHHVAADPVLVWADSSLGEVARAMLDAKALRVVVVDGQGRPVGMVSSLDVLAAVIDPVRPGQTEGLSAGRVRGTTRVPVDKPAVARARG